MGGVGYADITVPDCTGRTLISDGHAIISVPVSTSWTIGLGRGASSAIPVSSWRAGNGHTGCTVPGHA